MSLLLILVVTLAFSNIPKNEAADRPQSRVINGEIGTIEQFPFQAQLRLKVGIVFNTNAIPPIDVITDAFCGASIIHKNWVLTAAHCLSVNLVGFISAVVSVGSDTLDGGIHRDAHFIDFCPHPEYDRSTIVNDIGLIKIHEDLYSTPTSNIAPITLPQKPYTPSELFSWELIVSGFGRTADGSALSDDLMFGYMKAVATSHCTDPSQYGASFPGTAYCVTSATTAKTTFCNGDSGSPISHNGEQVCIVSFSRSGSCVGSLQGCTIIDIYIEWICCVTNEVICPPDYNCALGTGLDSVCPLVLVNPNSRK